MWSKLSADLLGKETQEALTANLTGALQKGKDAWQSIEQSLDVAVGHEEGLLGAGTEEGLPISIPPPLPSSSLALLRKESASTAAMVEEE